MDDFQKLCSPKTLEDWRAEAHRWFDRLWKYTPDPPSARSREYARLAEHFGLSEEEAHISLFGEYLCQETVKYAKRLVRGKSKKKTCS